MGLARARRTREHKDIRQDACALAFVFSHNASRDKSQLFFLGKEKTGMLSLENPVHLTALAGLVALVAACAPSAPPAGTSPGANPPAGKIVVVGTTTQVTSLASVVGGDAVNVIGLLHAGIDPHEFEPTPGDVQTMAKAQLIVENGVGLETWLNKIVENSGTKAPIVDSSKGVTIRNGDPNEPSGDPHIWHAVPNVIVMTDNIRDGLAQVDPPHADYYRANAAAYDKKLGDLDHYIQTQIATVPPANRKFVTNHDAFGYYVDRYGLTYVGSIIPSMDTSYEPSAKELANLEGAIKAQGVKAIFTETSVNPSLAQQIAGDAGVKVVDGALYGDSLGGPGSGADTVDGMLKVNTDIIVSNLK
jgi:zinc/manganese transport system substrate-binding protein/manganese/iron transport system substrate-binding protein